MVFCAVEAKRVVQTAPNDDLEYPASAQLLDGTILTIYSRSGR
jgi:hypothetical protein